MCQSEEQILLVHRNEWKRRVRRSSAAHVFSVIEGAFFGVLQRKIMDDFWVDDFQEIVPIICIWDRFY